MQADVINVFDPQYNGNLRTILETGERRTDRTGVNTISLFGVIRHDVDLRIAFPATTCKKLAFDTMRGETVDWMLKGKYDLKTLKDLGIRIWDQNVIPGTEVYEGAHLDLLQRLMMLGKYQQAVMNDFMEEIGVPFVRSEDGGRDFQLSARNENQNFAIENKLNNWGIPERALSDGDLGLIYGKQWRNWEDIRIIPSAEIYKHGVYEKYGARGFRYAGLEDANNVVIKREIDQIAELENAMRTRSDSRRIILTGWNVGQLDEMSLPPCHTMAQWFISQATDAMGRPYLDCMLYQRSNDMFLGCPFNVAQYALITHMLAHAHGLAVRYLRHTIGDAHIYENHIPFVEELLARPVSHSSPQLWIDGEHTSILDIESSQISMEGYSSHPAIKNVPIAK